MNFNINYPVPVLFGEETYLQAAQKIKENKVSKVLCIFDKGIKLAGIVEKIVSTLKAEGIKVIEFDGVMQDPSVEIIDAAGELARQEKVEAIIGIGGGSSMDAAKAVNVLLGNPGSISQYFDHSIPQNPGKPLFLIPTTAGTGSEVTTVAVISDTKAGKKRGVVGKNCTATLAIVDPTLTLGLPPDITAATGMDTFAHAAEAFTSAMSNPMSDILAIEAISLTARFLPVAVKESSNIEARSKMSFASTLAGMAFSNAFIHLGHAIAHAIGATHHVPHSIACGNVLPGAIEFVSDIMPEKVRVIGKAMGINVPENLFGKKLGFIVGDAVRELNKQIKLPTLKQFNIQESDFPGIAREALTAAGASHCPREFTEEDVLQILQKEYYFI